MSFIPSTNFSSCAITFFLSLSNYHWSSPKERALYFSTDFVMFSLIMGYKCSIFIRLIDLLVTTYPFIMKTKSRMS